MHMPMRLHLAIPLELCTPTDLRAHIQIHSVVHTHTRARIMHKHEYLRMRVRTRVRTRVRM